MIDSMCGAGKTSFMIDYINNHPDERFIFVSPYLSEIRRLKFSTRFQNGAIRFSEPEYLEGRKLNGFNALIEERCDIATTHATFMNSTPETIRSLQRGNYHLVIDETPEPLQLLSDLRQDGDGFRKGDVRMLLDDGHITVDEYGRVSWHGASYPDGSFSDIECHAKRGNLLMLGDDTLYWELPADLLRSFENVTVLTYLFVGSLFKAFLDFHGFEYEIERVYQQEDGSYTLVPHDGRYFEGSKFRDYIKIEGSEKLNSYRKAELSKTWYLGGCGKNSALQRMRLERVGRDLKNFFCNRAESKSVPASRIMWTCPKEVRDKIRSGGFTWTRRLTKEERELPKQEREKIENSLRCWQPRNLRATNKFMGRDVLAFASNVWVNPFFKNYFSRKGIAIDEDAYALAELIQWMWRSAIRSAEPKPIKVYLPSERMRKLFVGWLNLTGKQSDDSEEGGIEEKN